MIFVRVPEILLKEKILDFITRYMV